MRMQDIVNSKLLQGSCELIFQYFSYIMAVSFIGEGNRSTLRKPPTRQVTDKLYHIMLY